MVLSPIVSSNSALQSWEGSNEYFFFLFFFSNCMYVTCLPYYCTSCWFTTSSSYDSEGDLMIVVLQTSTSKHCSSLEHNLIFIRVHGYFDFNKSLIVWAVNCQQAHNSGLSLGNLWLKRGKKKTKKEEERWVMLSTKLVRGWYLQFSWRKIIIPSWQVHCGCLDLSGRKWGSEK